MSAGRSPQTWWRYPDGTPTPYFSTDIDAMLATHPEARAATPDTEETQP